MSKQNSAVERKGISTPENVAQATQSGKIPDIQCSLDIEILQPMNAAAGALMDLASLLRTIDEIAMQGIASGNASGVLHRIKHLCNIGGYLGDSLDCAYRTARDQYFPAIIAALGGEA